MFLGALADWFRQKMVLGCSEAGGLRILGGDKSAGGVEERLVVGS